MIRILRLILFTLTGLLAFLLSGNAFCLDIIEVGRFSAATAGQSLPDGWKPLAFKKIEKHTTYTLSSKKMMPWSSKLWQRHRPPA
jgi:hypothetical protein